MNEKKIDFKLLYSKKSILLFFVFYQICLYFLYLQTNLLENELVKSKKQLNDFAILEGVFLFIVVAPFLEELFFRHIVFKVLGKLNHFIVVILSSFLWAVLHLSDFILVFIMLLFLGGILGMSRIVSGTLIYPVFLHALNNAIFYCFLKEFS